VLRLEVRIWQLVAKRELKRRLRKLVNHDLVGRQTLGCRLEFGQLRQASWVCAARLEMARSSARQQARARPASYRLAPRPTGLAGERNKRAPSSAALA